ncbi:alcohol dehydrogenase catalytic domain-containing protein [Sutcliffiella horikoshii]|uniref:alcohol dehydrogenase catalytic domain-containing protein n=1 Tax=Sutcliffiella horikoshii TaxID=79883 RepID=UPI003850E9AB
MKAWLLKEAGSLDHMEWGESADPKEGKGELLVRVKAVALNPVDYKVAINGNPAWNYPHIVGVDLAGEVVSVGEGVSGFKAGDRVAIHTNLGEKGAFAELAVVDARADVAIDYKEENVTDRIMAETHGRGADLILNTVGRDVATEDLERLAFSGHLAYIAGKPDLSGVKPFSLSPSIHEVALGAAHASGDDRAVSNLAFMAEELMGMVKDGRLNSLVTKVLPREELVEGLKELQGRHVRGKIVVKM